MIPDAGPTPLDYGIADTKKRRALIRKLVIGSVLLVLAVVGWYVIQFVLMMQRIPEAYAAWDTGTLLVEYMKVHNDRWPKSWDDLLTVLDSEAGREILLRGSGAVDIEYAKSLRKQVAVNWTV